MSKWERCGYWRPSGGFRAAITPVGQTGDLSESSGSQSHATARALLQAERERVRAVADVGRAGVTGDRCAADRPNRTCRTPPSTPSSHAERQPRLPHPSSGTVRCAGNCTPYPPHRIHSVAGCYPWPATGASLLPIQKSRFPTEKSRFAAEKSRLPTEKSRFSALAGAAANASPAPVNAKVAARARTLLRTFPPDARVSRSPAVDRTERWNAGLSGKRAACGAIRIPDDRFRNGPRATGGPFSHGQASAALAIAFTIVLDV